jgi:hypothetical protein
MPQLIGGLGVLSWFLTIRDPVEKFPDHDSFIKAKSWLCTCFH